jgi:hypothetical protein
MVGADPLGRHEALVGVRRRHSDVDHGSVGLLEPDLAKQTLRVLCLGHHLDSGVLEQPGDSPAAEHDSSATTTRTGSPHAGW